MIYVVRAEEKWIQEYLVDAESEADALARFNDSEGEANDSFEFCEMIGVRDIVRA